MASRACFRMPNTTDADRIPDAVMTINDLMHFIRRFYNVPPSSHFLLRAWTRHGARKMTVVLENDQYIVDLEDNHAGANPPMSTLCWTASRGKIKERQKERRERQKPELEDRQDRTRKQARLDKHVCGICSRAECQGMCNACDHLHVLEVAV